MKRVVLYGAGSVYVSEVEEICRRLGWEISAYVMNVEGEVHASDRERVITPEEIDPALCRFPVLIPLLTPGHRFTIVRELERFGFVARPPAVDPTVVVASSVEIEEGVIVNAAAVLAAGVKLGGFSSINRSASIGHHTTLEDFATVGPGVVTAGSVTIGKGAFIGVGAVILPGCRIGENAIVGGGAVVREDVPARSIVVGNPARVVKTGITGYNGVGVP